MDQVESLCALLSDEARLWDEVAGLLRQEQRAVVELRPGTLLACLEERQALQEEVLALATRRRQLVRDVARSCGADTDRATLLLPLLPPGSQEGLRARLA